VPALSSRGGWQRDPSARRSLLWALFILCVMATASMTAGAETRLLGPPIADATPLGTPACSYRDPQTTSPVCSAAGAAISLEAQQYEAALQCSGNIDQRICADMLTRSVQPGTPPGCDDECRSSMLTIQTTAAYVSACTGVSGECNFASERETAAALTPVPVICLGYDLDIQEAYDCTPTPAAA
jgi:hypothetical protein